MRLLRLVLLFSLPILASTAIPSRGGSSVFFSLTETEDHHVAKLNSNQPYVAGCCVTSEDLMKYGSVDATAVEVSFPSTDPTHFPSESWLAAGMFVQAQDTKFLHVDYGFYMMLVLEASGTLFVDIGLHQTREGAMPLLMPSEELIYARTWQLSSLDPATIVTLAMEWDENKRVNYSVGLDGQKIDFASIHVPSLPNCQNIIPGFYSGNVIVGQFPMSRYVNYFQFGVTSSAPIAESNWTALLQEPRTFRSGNWFLVDRAWSIQGDRSYIDQDWKWGGESYVGVDAQYQMNPLQSPNRLLFFHSDRTLQTGTLLWEPTNIGTSGSADRQNAQDVRSHSDCHWPTLYLASVFVVASASANAICWISRKKLYTL